MYVNSVRGEWSSQLYLNLKIHTLNMSSKLCILRSTWPVLKSVLIISQFSILEEVCINHLPLLVWKGYILSYITWPLIFLGFLEIWAIRNKLCNASLHSTPPIDFPQVTVHLFGIRMNRISETKELLYDFM